MGKSFAVRNRGCRPWAICWTPGCWVWGRRTWRLWVAVLEIRSEWTPAGNMSRKKNDNKPVGLVIRHEFFMQQLIQYHVYCWYFNDLLDGILFAHIFEVNGIRKFSFYDQWQSTLPATNASFGSIQGLPRNLQMIKANEHWLKKHPFFVYFVRCSKT